MRNTNSLRKRRCQLEKLEERQLLFFHDALFLPNFQNFDQGFVVRANEPEMVKLETWQSPWQHQYLATDMVDPATTEVAYQLVLVGQPLHGQAAISADGRSILYKPNAAYVGQDKLSYTISYSDSQARSVPDDEIRNISIVVLEQPWLTVPDWTQAKSGETVQLDVIQNDVPNARFVGSDGWKLSVIAASSSKGGRVAIADDERTLSYQAPADFSGVDDISYTAKDQDGFTVKGTAKIRVVSTNGPRVVWPEQVDQLLIEMAVKQNSGSFGLIGGGYNYYPLALGPTDVLLTADDASLDSEINSLPTYTGTNNQLENVDEADWAKTDGEFLYILSSSNPWFSGLFTTTDAAFRDVSNSTLTIMNVRNPGSPEFVSALDLGADRVISQDLHEDRLTVFFDRGGQTLMKVFDTSNPASLKLVSTTEYPGVFSQARRVGDRLILITQSQPSIPYPESIPLETQPPIEAKAIVLPVWGPPMSLSITETGQQYLARVGGSLQELVFPSYVVRDGQGNEIASENALEFDQLQLEPIKDFGNMLNIITVNTNNSSDQVTDWDLGRGLANILVTQQSIYLAGASPTEFDSTFVDKFDLNNSGVQYAASGLVSGFVLNSFSMDEHQGNLRIATSTSNETSNSLFVLSENDGSLDVVGSVTGLAPGEVIYAARFVEDRAFLVTFEQVDPLFVIDLSDPTKPIVEGELKIPGYSQYLELIDQDHLLSVGRDADPESGVWGGVVVSLFDVSNSSSPKLKSRYEIEGGPEIQTPLGWAGRGMFDHHAVRYFDSHQTLTLPVHGLPSWDFSSLDAGHKMLTFAMDVDKGISQSNVIDFDTPVARAMRIGDYLYSMSQYELKVTSLVNPGAVLFEYEFASTPTYDPDIEIDPDPDTEIDPDPDTETEVINHLVPVEVTAGQPITLNLPDLIAPLTASQQNIVATILDARWDTGAGVIEIVDDGTRIKITPERHARGPQIVRYFVGNSSNYREATLEVIAKAWEWHNANNNLDTSGDGIVSPTDALLTINLLNEIGGTSTDRLDSLYADGSLNSLYHLDCNKDGRVSPTDALEVINHLNSEAEAEAEATRLMHGTGETAVTSFAFLPELEEIHKRKR